MIHASVCACVCVVNHTLASSSSVLLVRVSACWSLSWNSLGVRIAGAKKRRKKNPLMARYFTSCKQDVSLTGRLLNLRIVSQDDSCSRITCNSHVKWLNLSHTHKPYRYIKIHRKGVSSCFFFCAADWPHSQVQQIAPLLSCVAVWRPLSWQGDTDRPSPRLIQWCWLSSPAASPHCCPAPLLLRPHL